MRRGEMRESGHVVRVLLLLAPFLILPVAGWGQLKVRETTTLQPNETSKSLDWAPGAVANDSPISG